MWWITNVLLIVCKSIERNNKQSNSGVFTWWTINLILIEHAGYELQNMDDSDMLNQRHGWSPQSAPFQGGLTRPVSQFSIIPNVRYDLNPSFCSWVMVFNNGVSAEHHDVTVKMTIDLYDVKCQHVITLSCQTLVWGFVVISVWILKLQRKCVLWGHRDLWPPESGQFILESKGMIVPDIKTLDITFMGWKVKNERTDR